MNAGKEESKLFPYRVLDLSNERDLLCGKILADLGADVIKVEPPGGEPYRNTAPFYRGIPDPEKSLIWFAYNLNKRGITLDISVNNGQNLFKQLVKTADFVIESFDPDYMESLGLGYADLCKINSRIIMTSITPYGQQGPYKYYKASDITLIAMGGLSYITGFPDRPPVRVSYPQSGLLAGSQAAAASMIAHHHRQSTGQGQHVDVSMQACITAMLANLIPIWEFTGTNLKRQGAAISGRGVNNTTIRMVYPCKDGLISCNIMGGTFGAKSNTGLAKWIAEEGLSDDFLNNFDWAGYDVAKTTQEIQSKLEGYAEKFFLKHTKKELYEEAFRRNIILAPVNSPKDVTQDIQLRERNFWRVISHPELDATISYPGYFFKASQYKPETRYRPPLIGEHNLEIYKEIGISGAELTALKKNKII